jgi:hypothetical protein
LDLLPLDSVDIVGAYASQPGRLQDEQQRVGPHRPGARRFTQLRQEFLHQTMTSAPLLTSFHVQDVQIAADNDVTF